MKLVENKALIASESGERFAFALEREPERVFELPLVQDLPARQVQKLAGAQDDGTVMFDLLDALAPDLLDVATQRELAAILDAWSEASQVTPGE